MGNKKSKPANEVEDHVNRLRLRIRERQYYSNSLIFKIFFVGDQQVGKSSILTAIDKGKIDKTKQYQPTIGLDFLRITRIHKQLQFKIQLWDSSGQRRFRTIIKSFRGFFYMIIVFDVTNKHSFWNSQDWVQFCSHQEFKSGWLVGTKIDLKTKRRVSTQRGKDMAKKLGLEYVQVSSKTGENINLLMDLLVVDYQKNVYKPGPQITD